MECAFAWALPLFTLDEIVKPKEKGKKGSKEKVGKLQFDLQLRIILIAPKGSWNLYNKGRTSRLMHGLQNYPLRMSHMGYEKTGF